MILSIANAKANKFINSIIKASVTKTYLQYGLPPYYSAFNSSWIAQNNRCLFRKQLSREFQTTARDLFSDQESNSFSIVKLSPSDWEKYKILRLDALKTDPTAFEEELLNATSLPDQEWKNRLQSNDDNSFIMFARNSKGTLIGMTRTFINQEEQEAIISSVYVVPGYRGQGIAKKLIITIMNLLKKDERITNLRLVVNTSNARAIQLYKSLGFKIINILENYVTINNISIDAYLMIYKI